MTPNQATIRIRQLCTLGLPPQAILPDLLRELHALVPSHGNMFCWAGKAGSLSGGYMEIPDTETVLNEYAAVFCNRREAEVMQTFQETISYPRPIRSLDEMLHIPWRKFRNHDMYQRIIRPLQIRHALSVCPRLPRQAGLGGLMLLRTGRESAFTASERQRLAGVLPHLTHALSCKNKPEPADMENSGDGFVILDGRFRIQHTNLQARRQFDLLRMAATSRPAEDPHGRVTDAMRTVARRLYEADRALPGSTAPSLRIRTLVGDFTLRADWLDRTDTGNRLILVTLRQYVPTRLWAYRALRETRLSDRQLQIALRLAEGKTYSGIAAEQGLKTSSVITHARHLFDKLGVAGRDSFIDALQ